MTARGASAKMSLETHSRAGIHIMFSAQRAPKVKAKLSTGLHTTLRKTGLGKYKDINWLQIEFFWVAVTDDTSVSL